MGIWHKIRMWLFLVVSLCVMLWLSSCASKKETVHKVSEIKSDTLIMKSEVVKTPPILSSVIINEICDSITGKANDFEQVFVVGQDTMKLSIENNKLRLQLSKDSATISEYIDRYKAEHEKVLELEKNTRTIVKWTKWTWIFLMWAIVATALHFIGIGDIWKGIKGLV